MASIKDPSSLATGSQLGTSTFSLFVDAGNFESELAKAESTAKSASNRIGSAFGRGSSAGMGLLYLGQAVDDLQYGFRAIANNIPQITMAMGGGAGLAGGIGIAAVAISQVVNHLDELKAAAENSEPIQHLIDQFSDLAAKLDDVSRAATGRGVVALLKDLSVVGAAETVLDALGLGSGARAAGRAIAREHTAGQAAAEDVGKVQSQDRQDRAKMFKEALEAYGGGEKLLQEYTQRLQNGNPDLELGRARDMAASAIKEAMQGGRFGGGQFGGAFEKEYDKVASEAADKAFEKVVKEIDRVIKEAGDAKAREARGLNQAGAENEARMRNQLEVERDAMQKRLQAGREQLSTMKTSQTFGSTRDYLGAVSSGGANGIRKQQLDRLKGIEKGVDKLNDQIKAIGRARFG